MPGAMTEIPGEMLSDVMDVALTPSRVFENLAILQILPVGGFTIGSQA
jgi:hypothetical protein